MDALFPPEKRTPANRTPANRTPTPLNRQADVNGRPRSSGIQLQQSSFKFNDLGTDVLNECVILTIIL